MKVRALLTIVGLCSMVSLTGCASKSGKSDVDTTYGSTTASNPATKGGASTTSAASSTQNDSGSISTDRISDSTLPGSLTDGNAADNGGAAAEKRTKVDGTEADSGLENVYFGFDAYLLSAEAREVLTRNAGLLGANASRVSIEGHADERGSDEYNLALAEKRAVAARRYLESLGIDQERMEVVSYGEDKPAVEGSDDSAWAKNRRVEFVIVK